MAERNEMNPKKIAGVKEWKAAPAARTDIIRTLPMVVAFECTDD
jgi:hypothetical protein